VKTTSYISAVNKKRDLEKQYQDGDPQLTAEFKEFAKTLGADLIGIGSADWHIQKGHRPRDMYPNVTRVVSIIVRRLDSAYDYTPLRTRIYADEYVASAMNGEISWRLSRFLGNKGYHAVNAGQDKGNFNAKRIHTDDDVPHIYWANFSQKHVAISAGTGAVGRNNLVHSESFGPRMSLNAIFTDAPLVLDPAAPDLCEDDCKDCFEACPSGALTPAGLDPHRCWAIGMEVLGPEIIYIKWKPCPTPCFAVCPIGGEPPRRLKGKEIHPLGWPEQTTMP
jgi:epoxyqueuosine reductase QueG